MFTIGRLAKQAGVSTDTLRFYERQGLIAPASTTATGYRLFTGETLREVAFIKHAQRCGFSLSEIREMRQLSGGPDGAAKQAYGIAVRKKREIEDTITDLQSMAQALSALIDSLAADPDCVPVAWRIPLLNALERKIARDNAAA